MIDKSEHDQRTKSHSTISAGGTRRPSNIRNDRAMSPVYSSRSTMYRKKRESIGSIDSGDGSRSRVSRLEKGKVKSPEN
jgi:hypothetical protein